MAWFTHLNKVYLLQADPVEVCHCGTRGPLNSRGECEGCAEAYDAAEAKDGRDRLERSADGVTRVLDYMAARV